MLANKPMVKLIFDELTAIMTAFDAIETAPASTPPQPSSSEQLAKPAEPSAGADKEKADAGAEAVPEQSAVPEEAGTGGGAENVLASLSLSDTAGMDMADERMLQVALCLGTICIRTCMHACMHACIHAYIHTYPDADRAAQKDASKTQNYIRLLGGTATSSAPPKCGRE